MGSLLEGSCEFYVGGLPAEAVNTPSGDVLGQIFLLLAGVGLDSLEGPFQIELQGPVF